MNTAVRSIALFLVSAAGAQAGSWLLMEQACHDAFAVPDRFRVEDCIIKFLGLDPVHLTFNNIAPGSGPGFGLVAQKLIPADQVQHQFSATGVVSTKGFFFAQGMYTVHFPAIGQWDPLTSTLKDVATVSLYARRMDLREQDFYGIGAGTSLAGLAEYSQRQTSAGLAANYPLTRWMVAGGTVQYLQPRVGRPADPAAIAMDARYNEQTAPGLQQQPDYANYEFHLQLRSPAQPPFQQGLTAGYAWYHDLDSGRYTFRRLSLSGFRSFDFLRSYPTGPAAPKRAFAQNLLCSPQRATGRCSLGTLTFTGRASFSDHSASAAVPFYLQETMGGSDINGNDSLRAFRDYRFRAPNLLLLQAEVRHEIWGPLGILGFYEAGKVEQFRSAIDFTGLRHDIGLGLYFQVADKVVLRAFVGFGSGEGSRPNAKALNAF
jgi:hypothetical protein